MAADTLAHLLALRVTVDNFQTLHRKMYQMAYRPKPVRRVKIPKEDGMTRLLGIGCAADETV